MNVARLDASSRRQRHQRAARGATRCQVRRLGAAGLLALCRTGMVDGSGPLYWRLACSSPTTAAWRVCNVRFLADQLCQAGALTIVDVMSSNSVTPSGTQTPGLLFSTWTSDCSTCAADEAWVTARLEQPGVVQCVRFQKCSASTPSPTAGAPPPAAPGPSPPSGPSPTPVPPPPPPTASPTGLYNAQLADLSAQLEDTNAIPRRLSDENLTLASAEGGPEERRSLRARQLQAFASCTSVVLSRSSDNVVFSEVGMWSMAGSSWASDTSLSLATANARPSAGEVLLVDIQGSTHTTCTRCSAAFSQTHGYEVSPTESLDIRFNQEFYLGYGDVIINRGAGNAALRLSALRRRSSQVSKTNTGLSLYADASTPWGTSSGCSQVTFQAGVIVNADGHSCSSTSCAVNLCIMDRDPPVLDEWETELTESLPALPMLVRFYFFEEVVVVAGQEATLEVYATDPSYTGPSTLSLDLSAVTSTYSVGNRWAAEVALPVNLLVLENEYGLGIPEGAFEDLAGNPWAGDDIRILTGSASGSVQAIARTTLAQAASAGDTELHVVSTDDFTVGGTIQIAGQSGETNTIAAFGSILLNSPLQQNWPMGVTIKQVPAPAGDSGASTSSEEEGGSSVFVALGIVTFVLLCGCCAMIIFKFCVMPALKPGPAPLKNMPAHTGSPREKKVNTGVYTAAGPTDTGTGTGSTSPYASANTAAAGGFVQGPRAAAQAQTASPAAPGGWASVPTAPAGVGAGGYRQGAKDDSSVKAGGPKPGVQRQRTGSFTEDSSVGGGSLKQFDKETGKPYWYHFKTLERRWDPPPKSGDAKDAKDAKSPDAKPRFDSPPSRDKKKKKDPAAGQAGHGASGAAGGEGSTPDAQMPGQVPVDDNDSEEVKRVKADIFEQLNTTRKEDISSRKKTFKFLVLRWHPDKNVEDKELATPVFQFLQDQKDWYLKE